MDVLIEAQSLSKHYRLSGKHTLQAVEDVTFAIGKGEILGLVGESGCGKSTLGRLLINLAAPTRGHVVFEGTDIATLSHREQTSLRASMQMIFQDPCASFNPRIRLGQALSEVGHYHGMGKQGTAQRIEELLDYINLSPDVLSRGPAELSGGQLQRLAIARALMTGPAFIVADEPVSALDVSVQAQLLNLLSDLRARVSMTMLFISHDISVVDYLCDRVAVMYLGCIVEVARTEDLFTNVLHPYTRALIAAAPTLDGLPIEPLQGDPPNPIDVPVGCRFCSRCPSALEQCSQESPPLVAITQDHLVACHLCQPDSLYSI